MPTGGHGDRTVPKSPPWHVAQGRGCWCWCCAPHGVPQVMWVTTAKIMSGVCRHQESSVPVVTLKNGGRSLLFCVAQAAGMDILAWGSCVDAAVWIPENPGCSLSALLGLQQCLHNYHCLKDDWGFVSSGCTECPRTPPGPSSPMPPLTLPCCSPWLTCNIPSVHRDLLPSVSSQVPIPHQVPEMPLNSMHFAQ